MVNIPLSNCCPITDVLNMRESFTDPGHFATMFVMKNFASQMTWNSEYEVELMKVTSICVPFNISLK